MLLIEGTRKVAVHRGNAELQCGVLAVLFYAFPLIQTEK